MTGDRIKREIDSLTLGPNSCHRFGAPWRKSVDTPTAITSTWSDLERHARYIYECMDHDTTDWMLAEAVLVLLGER